MSIPTVGYPDDMIQRANKLLAAIEGACERTAHLNDMSRARVPISATRSIFGHFKKPTVRYEHGRFVRRDMYLLPATKRLALKQNIGSQEYAAVPIETFVLDQMYVSKYVPVACTYADLDELISLFSRIT